MMRYLLNTRPETHWTAFNEQKIVSENKNVMKNLET